MPRYRPAIEPAGPDELDDSTRWAETSLDGSTTCCHAYRFQTSRSSQPVSFPSIEKKYYPDFNPIGWNVANHTKDFKYFEKYTLIYIISLHLQLVAGTCGSFLLSKFWPDSFHLDTRSKRNNRKLNPQQRLTKKTALIQRRQWSSSAQSQCMSEQKLSSLLNQWKARVAMK